MVGRLFIDGRMCANNPIYNLYTHHSEYLTVVKI